MIKRVFTAVLCFVMAAGMSACTSENNDNAAADNNVDTATEAAEKTASWAVAKEVNFDFKASVFGFYSDEFAVSAGYAGEIHYINSQVSDWPRADNSSMCRFGLDIVNENVVYTCGNGGDITKSTDGSKTFEMKTKFGLSNPSQCRQLSFIDENTGIAAGPNKLGLTKDGAETWTELEHPTEICAVRMTSSDTMYYIGTDLNFYTSTDSGVTWSGTPINIPLENGIATNISSMAFNVDCNDECILFCTENETRLIKCFTTKDNWATCEEVLLPEVKSGGILYLNNSGTILSSTDKDKCVVTVLEKQ